MISLLKPPVNQSDDNRNSLSRKNIYCIAVFSEGLYALGNVLTGHVINVLIPINILAFML